MLEQQHTQQNLYDEQRASKIKNQRLTLIITIGAVALASAILWTLSSLGTIPSFWATILSVISTIIGTIITTLQFVISSYDTKASSVSTSPVSSTVVERYTGQITKPLSNPLLPAPAYHGISGLPPPTDARTIQQRTQEVERIYEQIVRPDTTAIVLTGIGGVGKSTLAALIYHYTEMQRRTGKGPFLAPPLWLRIDPAVTMVDLTGTLFELLDKSLLDFNAMSPQEQATRLFNLLNTIDKPRLIVLDQFENLLDWQTSYTLVSRPGIGEWLDTINSQVSRCRILLTSRTRPKGTYEYPPTYMQEYHVEGLAIVEGVDLLRKQAVKGTNIELQRAVEYCSGHAFALTLLALLMRNHNLSLRSLFLDPTYTQIWEGNIARNLLDYIYRQQINQSQRELLSGFSVYREPVPLIAACAVLEARNETLKIQDALHIVLAQHLLQATGDGYYQLHAIVANYAQNHFDESDDQANRQRLLLAHGRAATYYQKQAVTICPPQDQRRHINDIHMLLEAAWQYCQAEQWQEAYDLMKREEMFSSLKRWGGNATLLDLCRLLLQSNQWTLESSQCACIYNNLGDVYGVQGQVEQAILHYSQALQISQKITDPMEEGWALNNLGRIYNTLGNDERAHECLELALQMFKVAHNPSGEGRCITNLGWIYYDRGNMEQAQQYFEQALSIFKQENDQREEGFACGYLGRVHDDMGHRQLAQKYYGQALEVLNKIGDRSGVGIMLCNQGRVCNVLDNHEQALDYLKQALDMLKEVGDRSGEGTALNDLGRVYADLGQKKLAQGYFEQALLIRKEVGNRRGEARTLTDLGKIYVDLGQIQNAQIYFEQALKVLGEIKHGWREGRTFKNLSKVYTLLGKKDQALQCYEKALSIYKRIGNHWEEGTISFEIGLLYLEKKQYNVALPFFIIAQSVDEEVKDAYGDKIQKQLALISNKIGKENFAALLAIAESRSGGDIPSAAGYKEPNT